MQEPVGLERTHEPVEFSLVARAENCGDLERELRLFRFDTDDLTLTFGPKQQGASDSQREEIAAWFDTTTEPATAMRISIGPPSLASSKLQALVIAQHRGHSVAQFLHTVTERVDVHFEPKLGRDTVTIKPL